MTTHARVTLLSGLIISALLLTGCDNSDNQQPHAQAPQVTVHVVNSAPLSVTTELPGRTSAFRVAEVRPQVSGIILKRNFVEGSDVEAGQSLYQIDPATYQAAWNSAKGDEAKAEAAAAIAHLTVKRYVPLLGTKYISQQEYDQAVATARQADADVIATKAAVETARINLAYTKVTSPISGRIGKSSVTEGALVTNGQSDALATVQQLDPIYVDSKIHAWFRKQDRDKNILAGRQILDDELEHLGISLKDAEKHLLPRYNFNELDELLAAIGGGDIRLNQMVNFLQAQFNKPSAAEQDAAALKQLQQKTYTPQNRTKDNGRVVVEGVGNLMHHIARCCQPIPGDEIVGFITQGRGISVHRADCDQLAELQSHAPERIVDAVWGESYSAGYSLVVRVEANDRSGLLRDITTILANEKVNVLGVASRSDTRQQLATIDMTIEIYNLQVLGRVLGKLNQVPDVIDARRLHGG
ncbi:TPA: efflux RND transporter periplasmic adaptor subunit [Klebsiella pneumoniae]|nr:efflux RND transporter periplasmic adaptor subunit [Klebsiella pneumoniae]